jgi:hypothetical protein
VTDTCLNPLPAEVALPVLGFGVRLSEDGTAVLLDVPNGLYLVEVRHAGHASDSRLVRVAGDTARADFALTPIAAERGPAGARGGGDIARARLHYFIQRSATAMSPGTFITRHQIERRALCSATSGASASSVPPADGGSCARPKHQRADLVRVAHNAVRAGETTAVRGAGVTDIDRVKVSSVAALEIYASRGSAPPEVQLPGAECGVVLIWTAGVRARFSNAFPTSSSYSLRRE